MTLKIYSRCPIVEEEDSAVPLTSGDSRDHSANGAGCMVANIPSKEVCLTLYRFCRILVIGKPSEKNLISLEGP